MTDLVKVFKSNTKYCHFKTVVCLKSNASSDSMNIFFSGGGIFPEEYYELLECAEALNFLGLNIWGLNFWQGFWTSDSLNVWVQKFWTSGSELLECVAGYACVCVSALKPNLVVVFWEGERVIKFHMHISDRLESHTPLKWFCYWNLKIYQAGIWYLYDNTLIFFYEVMDIPLPRTWYVEKKRWWTKGIYEFHYGICDPSHFNPKSNETEKAVSCG